MKFLSIIRYGLLLAYFESSIGMIHAEKSIKSIIVGVGVRRAVKKILFFAYTE